MVDWSYHLTKVHFRSCTRNRITPGRAKFDVNNRSPPVGDGAKAWLLNVYSMSSVSPNKPARCCEGASIQDLSSAHALAGGFHSNIKNVSNIQTYWTVGCLCWSADSGTCPIGGFILIFSASPAIIFASLCARKKSASKNGTVEEAENLPSST
jgi:hypothetical protein